MPRTAEQVGNGSFAASLQGMVTTPGRLADDCVSTRVRFGGWTTA